LQKKYASRNTYLKKVFENIHEIEFDASKKIHAMFSAEKERVDFVKVNIKNFVTFSI
jgi:hypothetical protein